MGWWKAPAPPLCSRLASYLTSGTIFMARKGPVAQGEGLGWPSPQLHSGPQQEELSLSGITMALLGLSVTSSPTLDLSGMPQAWVPQASLSRLPSPLQSGTESSVLLGNASILCVLRAHTYTCTCMRTRTHKHTKCRCVCSDTYTS